MQKIDILDKFTIIGRKLGYNGKTLYISPSGKCLVANYDVNRLFVYDHLPLNFLSGDLTLEQIKLCVDLYKQKQQRLEQLTLTDYQRETLHTFEKQVQEWLNNKYRLNEII